MVGRDGKEGVEKRGNGRKGWRRGGSEKKGRGRGGYCRRKEKGERLDGKGERGG